MQRPERERERGDGVAVDKQEEARAELLQSRAADHWEESFSDRSRCRCLLLRAEMEEGTSPSAVRRSIGLLLLLHGKNSYTLISADPPFTSPISCADHRVMMYPGTEVGDPTVHPVLFYLRGRDRRQICRRGGRVVWFLSLRRSPADLVRPEFLLLQAFLSSARR